MTAREARIEFQRRQLTPEQLLELLEKQEQIIRRLQAELDRVKQRLAQYEPEIQQERRGREADGGPSTHYSVEAEEKRRRRKKRKKSPGRRPTQLKFSDAQRIEMIYPARVRRGDCELVRERAVWRLEQGRAVLVGYQIFRAPGGKEPRIPGVTLRCEYGIEILVVLSFLVYIIGISLDKACLVLGFFCRLPLSKSQADALLRQLARHWETEFETLCELLVQASVVYLDETGWKVGQENCSLWAFISQRERVFLFGCRKDAATLDTLLPPDVFGGVGVSDHAATYTNRFVAGQKCWAHLLRKAIRLALLYPQKRKYQQFLDKLLALYRDAKRAAADGRLGEAGRKRRVAELEDRLCELCLPHWNKPAAKARPDERDFYNLVNELLTLVMAEELFTFVLRPDVEPTNNVSERELRSPALDRKAGRTNKTAAGARRRSVIVSVLQSLKANLENFTLDAVVSEVTRWMKDGSSLFQETLQDLFGHQQPAADTS